MTVCGIKPLRWLGSTRPRRPLLLALSGAALLAPGIAYSLADAPKPLARTEPIKVEARPLAGFDKTDPAKVRFGKLVWRGGLVLTSPSPQFGGFSGLRLGDGGEALIAISDAGAWMRGELVYEKDRPAGIRSAVMGPIRAMSGEVLHSKRQVDAEGLALIKGTPADGSVLISFERNHRIGHFDIDGKGLRSPRKYLTLPRAIKNELNGNQGLEAIAILPGGPYEGSLVAIAERGKSEPGKHTGWIWVRGTPRAFHLADPDGYDITDTAGLADGSLLVLERRFRWGEGVKIRLRLIKSSELKPGADIDGENLLDANMGHEIDNMEGLAVHRGAGGDTIITMISDDNFNRDLQRTLLLQFTLARGDLARAPEHE